MATAQLTFPIVPDGLVADVLVNLEAALLVPLRASGGGPEPFQTRGLVDTASDLSAVALPILQQLGTPPVGQVTTRGIGGSVPAQLFRVSLHVFDARDLTLPWFSQPSLLVTALPPGFPFDVLLGLDVLLTCRMLLDGPAGQFTLTF